MTQPRQWTLTTADTPRPGGTARTAKPPGVVGLLADRVLVQTSAGEHLDSVLPWVGRDTSGLVIGRGRMSNRQNLQKLFAGLPKRGWDGPVVFDPEAYCHHTASVKEPLRLSKEGLFAETLTANLDAQRALGSDLALVPMGYVDVSRIDALKAGAALAAEADCTDTMFLAPLAIELLGDEHIAEVGGILAAIGLPVGLVLFGQFDPLDRDAKTLVRNLRSLVSGPTHYAVLRTDFNGLDLIAHGAFTAAIGTGGSLRHATAPNEQPHAFKRGDESPSVLYPRVASWWKGSKIAELHGRLPAPRCDCGACGGQNLARFLGRDRSHEARAHGVAIWQRWAEDLLSHTTIAGRSSYWKNFCAAAVDEHAMLAAQLGMTKRLAARPGLSAWAKLDA